MIYTVDDLAAPHHTPQNKGKESLAYLQYIVDHYNDLPSTIVFLHDHKDGPASWHVDNPAFNNVESIRALQADFVQRNGYVNLRCQTAPGCPAEIQPFRNPPSTSLTENLYENAYKELFNDTTVPEAIGVPCCSQFAVSRQQVMQRPLSDYQHFYRWVSEVELPDDTVANIMEFTWHIIFGQEPVL